MPPELVTDDEGVPFAGQVLGSDPASRAAGGSQVPKAARSFNTEEDDDDVTLPEQPAQQSTESSSGVPSSKAAASELAGTPPTPTGTKNG